LTVATNGKKLSSMSTKKRTKKNKQKKPWVPPAEWLAPVDPEQFKFCFTLMGAAASGAMVTPTPRPLLIEGVGEVSLKNIPLNRGMLAVSKHLQDVYPHPPGEMPSQIHATMFRLMSFGDFLRDCLKRGHPRSKQLIIAQNDGAEIHEALIEAGATAPIDHEEGFAADSLFQVAEALLATGRFDEEAASV
jgi:hypothetical protein